jgi:hypothetical protein
VRPAGMARRPILVTGMPRSGTTWLARLLATAPGTALAGREPMNPRGRQYALAGTLDGWTELTSLSPRQRRALRRAYAGVNPFVYSRYGRRQWAAALPWTRLVMKDPFAILSVPVVVDATGASAVLLYRHPGAALASYRRMRWQPDLDELRPVLRAHRARHGTGDRADLPATGESSAAEAMGSFWSALYEIALDNARGLERPVIVSHEELAGGGEAAAQRLFDALDLELSPDTRAELSRQGPETAVPPASGARGLHDLDRAPAAVAGEWRRRLEPGEVETIEAVSGQIRAELDRDRLRLSG